MRRREFIALVGGVAVAWPFAARAQQGQISMTKARVAFLGAESPSTNQHFVDAFLAKGCASAATQKVSILRSRSDGLKAEASAFPN